MELIRGVPVEICAGLTASADESPLRVFYEVLVPSSSIDVDSVSMRKVVSRCSSSNLLIFVSEKILYHYLAYEYSSSICWQGYLYID